VRYADDFVVLHQDPEVIAQIKQQTAVWLADLGLELKPSKTRIVHTLREHDGQRAGFDFLGFHVRQYAVGKTHAGKQTRRPGDPIKRLGFKTIITPSAEARRQHGTALREVVRRHRSAPQAALIRRLNGIIRGWSNYYATVAAKRVFVREDMHLYHKLRHWAHRRHPTKSTNWVVRKYWRLEQGTWDFATTDGVQLLRHARTPIRRHVKVRGAKSPYDGEWSYWTTRLGRHPELPQRVARLLKAQRGRCAWCGLHFTEEDGWEIDHVVPTSCGGTDERANRQLLHRHCHDQKTVRDGSRPGVPMTTGHAKEEPDEGKLSRPVLETSRSGDRLA
jgi:RNA-directed DNA polymerase